MVVIFLLMFALPKRPAQHVEGAEDTAVGEQESANPAAGAPVSGSEPALMG
jgi:hypothetical protein